LIVASRTPTEKAPRQFSIAPGGKHLYAVGQGSGNIALYHIDIESGDLTKFDSIAVGKRPWWVLAIDLP
jgi:6-phosphogluconolactonase